MSKPDLVKTFRERITGGLVSAPLAGTSDVPWYRLLAGEGISAFWTEMTTADGLFRGGRKTRAMLTPEPGRPGDPPRPLPRLHPDLGVPVVCQLFGHLPEAFAYAARFVELCGYDALDLNFGCPAKKVVRSGNGVALMRDLPLAVEIASATLESTSLPVTAKLRLGFASDPRIFLRLATELDGLGITALTLHPRTWEDGFSGVSDWSAIAELVGAVRCPVIGNGDVKNPEDARRMLESTGCHAVMAGRALIGEPWQARRMAQVLGGEEVGPEADWPERVGWTRRHGRLLCDFYGEKRAMFRVRRFALHYLRGVEGAGELRRRMAVVADSAEFERLLNEALAL
ncbi:MAG TPA: tRNA-dihydrouridine synthase [bacterium]|nr:tRNA-dihydrouridine synthase [bacterium]